MKLILTQWSISFSKFILAGVILVTFSACMHDEDGANTEVKTSNTMAVISTIQPDWSGGAHSTITVDEERIATNNILPTNSSDLIVASDGNNFYRIDRTFGGITKFKSELPDAPAQDEQSVNGADLSANPHDLVVVNETKAYVFRYNTNMVWEINPSAASAEDFKIAEIDFSHYADPDGNADPQSGLVIGNRLFVLLQNMEDKGNYNFEPATAYVAVIDIGTNEEIDTDATLDGVQPITLPVENPVKMIYQSSMDKIFIQASGDTYPENDYTGGIATININDYVVETLIDDDESTYSISNIAVVSDTVGYFVGYKAYQDTYLFQFNPTTGDIEPQTISDFDGKELSDIEVDKDGKLWVASFGEAGIYVFDPATNTVEGSIISTGLNPSDIEFVNLP